MTPLTTLLQALYLFCLLLIAGYACSTLYVIVIYLSLTYRKRTRPEPQPLPATGPFPKVAVQVPLYNERYVARRVVEAVAAMDYPRDCLHIQILDDSTDDTTELIQGRISQLRHEGLRIDLIRRPTRDGFKAGALANGFNQTDAEFIAIFDADFVPSSDFLKRVMPYFLADKTVGMVQTRWGHLNEADNVLTRSQALAFDGHFGVEQFARSAGEIVMSFNGTGGVWRRVCIEDAGGWHNDTLTEDFDLSYRAQLKGWRMTYLRDVVVPGEIPPQMDAYKHQQARWAKGSTQVLLKLGLSLLRSDLSWRNRVLGLLQMMQYAIQLAMLTLFFLTPPMIILGGFNNLAVAPLSLLTLSAPVLYALGQYAIYKKEWWRRTLYFPVLLLLGCGMSLNNGRAALSAILGQKSDFKRTPKFHLNGRSGWWTRRQYAALLNVTDITGEMILCGYSLIGLVAAIVDAPSMIPYLLFYSASYSMIIGWSLWDRWLMTRPARVIEGEVVRQPGR